MILKKKTKYLAPLFLIFLTAFSTIENAKKTIATANKFMETNQTENALQVYETHINKIESKGKKASSIIYEKAGIVAHKNGNIDQSISYFTKASELNFKSKEMLILFADCYKKIDNLSKEIAVLEDYMKFFPEGENIMEVKLRLFETCLETENWMLAHHLWTDFGTSAEKDIYLLSIYLKINATQKTKNAENLALKLLKLDNNNVIALEFFAEKYFWKAENCYQEEIEVYNKKKTKAQYNKLLVALESITKDFKTSLNYYQKLYKIAPEKKYAAYLSNIYGRLDNKDQSTYYKNKSQ